MPGASGVRSAMTTLVGVLQKISDRTFAAAAAAIVLLTAAVLWRIGYLNEIPSHTEDAWLILRGAIDPDETYRLPLGYPGFLAPFLAGLPEAAAVKTLNFLAYLVFLALAWRWLASGGGRRSGLGRVPSAALLAVLAAALLVHPYVMLSLSRTNESILAGALFMGLVLLMTRRPTLGSALVAGLLLGLSMHVRANGVSMALPLGVWLLWGESARGWRERLRLAVPRGAALAVAGGGAFALFSMAVAGVPDYRPSNGGYNLFAATNAYSWDEILRNQNAEYAMRKALPEHGVDFKQRNFVPQEQYVAWAREYAVAHPGEVVRLTALKAMTFFAPRLANANSPAKVALQFFAAGLFWISLGWTAVAFLRRRRWSDGMLLLIVASYAIPFILTNADPRMRFPLDLLFYVQLIALALAAAAKRFGSAGAEAARGT